MRDLSLVVMVFLIMLAGCSGTPSGMGSEADNDDLNRSIEKQLGTDPTKLDTDGDSLSDREEVKKYNTNPTTNDTDGDGLDDGTEVYNYESNPLATDTDGDGLKDGEEVNEYESNPNVIDTDGDGLNDSEEVSEYGTDPTVDDTDRDGLKDGEEVNRYGTDPTTPYTDGDTLKDGREVTELGTDPTRVDTDGDGLDDNKELNEYGTDPTVDIDKDDDGIYNIDDENPRHRDKYVLIQNKDGCDVSANKLAPVAEAFDEAPISNPDGDNGINIHFLYEEDPELKKYIIPYNTVIFQKGVYVNGNQVGGKATPNGLLVDCRFSDERLASNTMHELGHASGLYGWVDGVDSKKFLFEEYQSVMNYNAPNGYIGYAKRDWNRIAKETKNVGDKYISSIEDKNKD